MVSGGVWCCLEHVWWCLEHVWSPDSGGVNVHRLIWPELMYMGRYPIRPAMGESCICVFWFIHLYFGSHMHSEDYSWSNLLRCYSNSPTSIFHRWCTCYIGTSFELQWNPFLQFTAAWVLYFSAFANVRCKLTREIASPSGPFATRVISAPLLLHYCDSCLTHAVMFYCIVSTVPITSK